MSITAAPFSQWLVAAAVAALLLAGGSFVVRVVTDDDAQTEVPTDPGPSPTTAPVPTGGAAELPHVGATPSIPERGELVDSISFSTHSTGVGAGSFNLYADGRLIRRGLGTSLLSDLPGSVEQRLTADGVERVRSEFLAAGLFEPDDVADSGDAFIACFCQIWGRDRGQLLSTGTPMDPPRRADPEVRRRVDRLVQFVLELDSTLPASAWEDRDLRAYVPSRYWVCMDADTANGQPPITDPFAVLNQRVAAPVVQLLARARPTTGQDSCIDVTTGEARELAEALDDAGISRMADEERDGYLQYWFYAPEPGLGVFIHLSGLMPEGLMPNGEPLPEMGA
ncbi:MAG: hypothetical protein ABW009_14935 [Acidimicrobiales bacterium]